MNLDAVKKILLAVILISSYAYYVWLRVENSQSIHEPRVSFGDTPEYLKMARQSRLDPTFWIANKPPVAPLFFGLLNADPERIIVAQLWLSILSWGLLALAVCNAVRSYVIKPLAFLTVLGFSLTQNIIMWDALILSDSLSVSLMALFLAAGLWLLVEWRTYKAVLLVLLAVLLAFVRDTNAYWLLMIGASALLLLFFTRQRKRVLWVSGSFLLIFLASSIIASLGYHWYTAFLMTVGLRILPNPQYVAYFESRGMPVSDALMERSGKPFQADSAAMLFDHRLNDFRIWARQHGRSEYVRFLWFFKADALQAPLRDMERLFNPDAYYYAPTGYRPIIKQARINEFLYPTRFAVLAFFVSHMLAAALILPAMQYRQVMWLVPLMLVLFSYPQAVLIWSADANDIARHSLYHNLQLRLGMWLMLIFVLDFLVVEGIPFVQKILKDRKSGYFTPADSALD